MKRLKVGLLVFALCLFMASAASASLTLDILPSGPLTANTGDILEFSIYLNNEDADHSFALYGFELQLDPAELNFVGWTYADTPPGWTDHVATEPYGPNDPGDGDWPFYGSFNANHPLFEGYTLAPNEHLLLGTLTAQVLDPVEDGEWDVVLYFDLNFGDGFYFYDASGVLDTFQVTGPDVAPHGAAVPVPAAVWLLGSGLAGVIGWRRRFR